MLGSEIIHVGRRGSSEHKIWALHQINPILVFWLLRHQHTNIQASSYAPRCVSIQEGNYQMASFSIVHSSETGRLTKWSDGFDRCYDRNTTETPVKCQSDHKSIYKSRDFGLTRNHITKMSGMIWKRFLITRKWLRRDYKFMFMTVIDIRRFYDITGVSITIMD